LVGVMFAIGCGDSSSGGGSPDGSTPDGSTPDGPVPSGSGCGDAATIALSQWVEQMASVPGVGDRAYYVRLPSGYDPAHQYPLVFQLHGCFSGENRQINNVPVEGQSGTEAIHVRGKAATDCWDTSATGPDVPYFDYVLAAVEATYCVDADRRFLSGYSSGAFMAHRLGCIRGDVIRGIATIAGGFPGSACVGDVAALMIHDFDDQTVRIVPVGYPTRDQWIARNHCDSMYTATSDPPCIAYDGCDVGNPVVWCETTMQDHSRQDGLAAPIFWHFLSSLD
jgi:polyhydroxybutyrate depolymerase